MSFLNKKEANETDEDFELSFLNGSDDDASESRDSLKDGSEGDRKPALDENKKTKNLLALVIVLAGLFVGSLYVDIVQAFTKAGFSSRALATTDVVSAAGKTWVAYDQPIVHVTVLSEDSCKECQTDEALVWLRRIFPTVSAEVLDISKDQRAKDLAKSANISSIPAFIFSKEVAEVPVYEQAKQLFVPLNDKDGQYTLDIAQVGIPVGKYLELPTINDTDIQSGSKDAPVKVVEFTDFQCPYCKAFHATLEQTLKAYGDKVLYVYKNYPLPIHPQAENAALAGECANEQGKFSDYADTLFSKQDEWGKTTGVQKFKAYARTLGLDGAKFDACLDGKKYQDLVTASTEEGKKFGISGTPGTFVNGTFLNGAVPGSDLKSAIDAEIAAASK